MKSRLAAAVVFALACASVPAWADAPPPPAGVQPAPLAEPPWVSARAVLDAAMPDLNEGGIRALAPHVDAFEKALADADKPYAGGDAGEVVLLTDGMMDMIVALAAAGKSHPDRKAVAIDDPFPAIALFLASYYNEVGRFNDALRVVDREFALNQGTLGEHRPALASERAVALVQLYRLAEALAAYEDGLQLPALDDMGKARMHRGRGYVLTEMGRLDEAEAAYRESLKLEPNNKLALDELAYIAKLKAGGAKEPGVTVLPEATPDAQPDAKPDAKPE